MYSLLRFTCQLIHCSLAANTVGAENVVGLNVHNDVVEPVARSVVDVEKGHNVHTAATNEAAESQADSLETASQIVDLEAYPPPTEEERTTLRKVYGSVPWTAWTLCFVELAERGSYYGAKAVFNNYIQFPLPEGGDGTGAIDPSKPNSHAGALGLGLQAASALTLLFTFLAYVIPIFGAVSNSRNCFLLSLAT
ncbi:hypothetical protein F4680DRAFT_169025 [Xylaria scruposa]|nr:hypothetical protein F4680DRAFT_169025 [Xylaria scruposa]